MAFLGHLSFHDKFSIPRDSRNYTGIFHYPSPFHSLDGFINNMQVHPSMSTQRLSNGLMAWVRYVTRTLLQIHGDQKYLHYVLSIQSLFTLRVL